MDWKFIIGPSETLHAFATGGGGGGVSTLLIEYLVIQRTAKGKPRTVAAFAEDREMEALEYASLMGSGWTVQRRERLVAR